MHKIRQSVASAAVALVKAIAFTAILAGAFAAPPRNGAASPCCFDAERVPDGASGSGRGALGALAAAANGPQFAQRKMVPPRITKIVPQRHGYSILGRGFGTSRTAIAVYQNDKRLPARSIVRVIDTRIDVRGVPSGTVRVRVTRGAIRTNALTYRFAPPSRTTTTMRRTVPSTGSPAAGRGTTTLSPAQKLLMAKSSARDMRRSGRSAADAARAQKDSYGASPQQAFKNLIDGGFPVASALDAMKRIFQRPDEFTISLLKSVGLGVRKATRAAVTTFKDKAAGWLLENLTRIGYDPKDVAFDLKSMAKLTGHVAALTLQKLRVKADRVTRILKDVYKMAPPQAVRILKQAGYRIEAVALALKRVYNLSAGAATGILKSVFNASATVLARVMAAAGWTHEKVGEALKLLYNLAAPAAAQVMKAAGWTADKTGVVLRRVYNLAAPAAAQAMKAAGWTADKVGVVLRRVYNLAAPATALAMKAAGWGANTIARTLQRVHRASSNSIAVSLKAAGWGAQTVANALKSVGKTAKTAARAMKQAGFGARTIAGAIKAKYQQSAGQMARILADIGFSFNAIKDALVHAFQMNVASVLALLSQLEIR